MMLWTIPNFRTIFRLILIPFFIAVVLSYSPADDRLRFFALGIFVIAVLTDLLDGYIARRFKQQTVWGGIIDPLADKILLSGAFICLYAVGDHFEVLRFPFWFIAVLLGRDIFLMAGAAVIWKKTGRFEIRPGILGKATTFLQILCILGMLMQWNFTVIFWYAALVVTIASGGLYIQSGIKVLNASHR